MAGSDPKFAWMNGQVVPWEDAKIHVHTDGVRYGANVFEGLRGYASEDKQQVYVFRVKEHMDRLYNSSMKVLRMQLRWNEEELTAGMLEMLRANDYHGDIHIRPTVYYGKGGMYSFDPNVVEWECSIVGVERPAKPSLWTGITAKTSTWTRIDDTSMPPRVKSGANYVHGRYAAMEAHINGFDVAIILNARGKVAEGTGACVMMVRNGKVITPPVTAGILESITRETLIDLFQTELGIEVIERDIDRTELYVADEVFFCGTGAEIQPITSVDKYPVGTGETGPVVKQIQDLYFRIVRGQEAKYQEWLTPVY